MKALTKIEIGKLGEQLARRAAELRALVGHQSAQLAGADYAERAGSVTDTGDEANADVLNDTEHAMLSQHLAELEAIRAAQSRLHEGEYGLCVDCGGVIDVRRLHAWPAAARCLACQEKLEHASGEGRMHSL